MTAQEEFDWYGREIAKARRDLDKKRQEFFDLDAHVSRLERERSRLFHAMLDERTPIPNGER